MTNKIFSASLRLCGFVLLASMSLLAQIPAPKDVIGFTPGDDRKLASWASIVDYFKRLDTASDRMIFEEIGKTTMGAPFVYATISSPENLRNLKKYRDINDKLADPRKITGRNGKPIYGAARDAVAKQLIAQGKTIVLITLGIHSTEVGSTLSSMLLAHRLASSNEPEIKKILDNTIILLVPSLNPDGVDIVKNWYDKTLGTKFEGTEPPELYHKYVGHDNNRDWYAFTQVETQLTVDQIHNVWHPQIVHDIHQQGQNGSRLFLPPYMEPVEPNVPKQIVEGYTELGNAMADSMRKMGYQGITTGTTYDAWTPARAYSHYHGGVRILSETASARLATPVEVKFDELRVPGNHGYDPKVESEKFSPVWKGGEWKLRNITDYMTTAAFALMNHAADNRERWLSRFYEIGKEAVRPRKAGELWGFIIPPGKDQGDGFVIGSLASAGVEVDVVKPFTFNGRTYPDGTKVIRLAQPYGGFAKAMLEQQAYPNLQDPSGSPLPPYDVTAHTLPLLTGVVVVPVYKNLQFRRSDPYSVVNDMNVACITNTYVVQIYRSSIPSMDEGWTRWLLKNTERERHEYILACELLVYSSLSNASIRNNRIDAKIENSRSKEPGVVIFPDQSSNQILNGYAKGTMPDEYVGGVGKEGVENLKKFVENGGTLVFLNRSTEFAIEQFNLPVRNVVKGVARKDFYIPGSILRTELDLTHPIAKGMPQQSIAWFENGPAFEVLSEPPAVAGGLTGENSGAANEGLVQPPTTAGGSDRVRIIARYPSDPKQILLSGWALGAEKIAGKAALVEVTVGKGKIILFGFRPQYRGQSLATFPLLFNSISH